ncbi:MAG: hypothetical protein IPM23_19100 [Candidatus Melainabacteria bacterium]|nr:hypothetical protein [Candidatus Melainabacteria bacterium]
MKFAQASSKSLVLLSIFLLSQTNLAVLAQTEPATPEAPVALEESQPSNDNPEQMESQAAEPQLEEPQIEKPPISKTPEKRLIAQAQDEPPVLRQGISVSDREIENKIDGLTRDILLKLVELERYGINYNLISAKQGRWKGWRYGFFGEANLGLGLAGCITSVVNRGGNLSRPGRVNVHLQESCNYMPMIGNLIGAGGAGIELGLNGLHEFQAMRKGYSPSQARKRVKNLRTEIESLLEERARMIQAAFSVETLKDRAELDQAEEKVLRDLLAQSLQQFERFYIGKRRLIAFQQMQYLFDISKNVTSAVGYQFAYDSLSHKHRVYNGRAGIMFVVSGALFTAGPVLSRAFGKLMAERHRRLLRPTTRVAEEQTLERLKSDHELLDRFCKNSDCDKADLVVDRSASIYASGEKHFEDEISRSEKAEDKAKLIATQNIAAGTFVGGTKIASGVLFIIPGYNRRYNANSGGKAARGTNDFLFASSLISIPATSFAILDTLRINIQGEINRKRLKEKGELPGQLAQARLEELDQIEKRVKAIKLR